MKVINKNKKDLLIQLIVILAAALFVILITHEELFYVPQLRQLELKLIDSRFQHRGPIDLGDSADVVIVEINQTTYDQIPQPFNRWPWPRSVFAKVIENLSEAGAKGIGIDINMPGADQYSPLNDSLMFSAIKKSGRVVVAGTIDIAREVNVGAGKSFISNAHENFNNIFYDADSSLGLVQPPPDHDGVFRRYLPYAFSQAANKRIPSFGFALLNKYYGLKNTSTALSEDGYFKLGSQLIPKYDNHTVLVNFYGPSRTFPHISLIDVLDDKDFKTIDEVDFGVDINTWDIEGGLLASGIFKNKIVLIGSTMPEDRDLLPISFAKGEKEGDNLMYGVQYHANMIQNIIRKDFLYKQSNVSEIFLILLFTVIIFMITSVVRKLKLKIGLLIEFLNLVLIACFIYGFYELSVYVFLKYNLVLVIVAPSLAIAVGYISSTAYHLIQERQQNLFIKGVFGKYVNKSVVNELISNPQKLQLGGEKKNLTILFSDIAGFTTFAERKTPEELVSFINEFLHEMSDIILINEGTLDKYLGDAVMAFWGAPIEVEDHARKACLTALEMQSRLISLREKWLESGETPIRIRIGINTGDVIVGNIGGEERFDYTVLGDDVNLASRLEGANKEYGSNIMIGESTFDLVQNEFNVRELDVIRVKGKSEPTKVYELISRKGDEKAEEAISKMDFYFQGLDLYRNKSFEPAHDYFKRAFEQLGDFPSKVYMQRCEFYMANPPADDWDRVFEFKTK